VQLNLTQPNSIPLLWKGEKSLRCDTAWRCSTHLSWTAFTIGTSVSWTGCRHSKVTRP